jgi:hypothetical protein
MSLDKIVFVLRLIIPNLKAKKILLCFRQGRTIVQYEYGEYSFQTLVGGRCARNVPIG